MENDLMKQINQMLTEVKAGKHKKKKKKSIRGKKDSAEEKGNPNSLEIPWSDEALVLIATTTTCKSCGNEVTSWSPYLYIERSRTVRRKVSTMIERLPICDPDIAYESLPRRIEHRHHTTCRCHLCFGNLPNGFKKQSIQLTLPFDKEYYHESNDN